MQSTDGGPRRPRYSRKSSQDPKEARMWAALPFVFDAYRVLRTMRLSGIVHSHKVRCSIHFDDAKFNCAHVKVKKATICFTSHSAEKSMFLCLHFATLTNFYYSAPLAFMTNNA
jgi:hypothetical protein